MMTLRPQQRTTVDEAKVILKNHGLLYMVCEMRTGKTIMSLSIAFELKLKTVLFLTNKANIINVETDLINTRYKFEKIDITNYEQVIATNPPKPEYDLVICDEATILSGYPKPGAIAKKVKELCKGRLVILMSGTPTAESPVQIFHQMWVCDRSPFSVHKNFYAFFKEYGIPKKKFVRGFQINDYKSANEFKIKEITKHYMVTLSQKEAGFESLVEEEVLYVKVDQRLYKLMDVLKKKKVYEMRSGDTLVADTPVKLQSLCHQISSGTVIGEDRSHVIDESKIWFIKTKFAGQKIAIYHKYVMEGELIRQHFPNHTSDQEEFNRRSDLVFVRQISSGRFGVNLSTADCLVMYNIDFSATSYFQVRARMQTKDRTKASKIYWIFSEHGLEKYVYKAVSKKMNFTNAYFKDAQREMSSTPVHSGS
jgi:hypothetical protein